MKNKLAISLLSLAISSPLMAMSVDEIELNIKSDTANLIPSVIDDGDKRFTHKTPTTIYLLKNNREDLAVEYIKAGGDFNEAINYKGVVYAPKEVVALLGYESFISKLKDLNAVDEDRARAIKENREAIYKNPQKTQDDIDREQAIVKKLNNGLLEEILQDGEEEIFEYFIAAIIDGNNDVADIFIPYVDVNKINDNGMSPLMAASVAKNIPGGNVEYAIKLVVEHGAKPNLKNGVGMSAIHFSASTNAYRTLVFLLDNKSNFMEPDDTGSTAVDYAIRSEAYESLFIIKQALDAISDKSGLQMP